MYCGSFGRSSREESFYDRGSPQNFSGSSIPNPEAKSNSIPMKNCTVQVEKHLIFGSKIAIPTNLG